MYTNGEILQRSFVHTMYHNYLSQNVKPRKKIIIIPHAQHTAQLVNHQREVPTSCSQATGHFWSPMLHT